MPLLHRFTPKVAALLHLSLLSPFATVCTAQSQAGQPPLSPYLYRWSFEAGGFSETEFHEGVRGGELTVSGGGTNAVPVFQSTGGVGASTPGVLNASRNHYGSANGAQVNSYGSVLRNGHTLGQFTITMWIKPTLPANQQPYARLLNLSSNNNEQSAQSILLALDNDSFSFSVNGSPITKVEVTEPVVKTDEWLFLVFCYDGLTENTYYSHDMIAATKSSNNAAILAGDLSGPTRLISKSAITTGAPAYNVSPGNISVDGLLIAAGSSNSRFDRAFVGYIDDIRIYDGLLTQAERESVRREASVK